MYFWSEYGIEYGIMNIMVLRVLEVLNGDYGSGHIFDRIMTDIMISVMRGNIGVEWHDIDILTRRICTHCDARGTAS
jgi:hypothetical protein